MIRAASEFLEEPSIASFLVRKLAARIFAGYVLLLVSLSPGGAQRARVYSNFRMIFRREISAPKAYWRRSYSTASRLRPDFSWRYLATAVALIAVVILGSAATVKSDAVMSVGAYWPGSHLIEFLASSACSSCRDIPMPANTRILQHMRFDSKDNLWMTGQKSALSLPLGLVEAAASHNYHHFDTVDTQLIGPYAPFVFDRHGNLWARRDTVRWHSYNFALGTPQFDRLHSAQTNRRSQQPRHVGSRDRWLGQFMDSRVPYRRLGCGTYGSGP